MMKNKIWFRRNFLINLDNLQSRQVSNNSGFQMSKYMHDFSMSDITVIVKEDEIA